MTPLSDPSPPSVAAVVGAKRSARRLSDPRLWLVAALLAAALVLLWLWLRHAGQSDAIVYQQEPVVRAPLVVKVSATGNLQPTNQVDVGSELSGTVETVLVDANDHVRKGQVMARLDTSKLQDQVEKSAAALAAAQAKVQQSDATSKEVGANLRRLREVARLSGGKVPAESELAAAEANLTRAQADAASARAAVVQAAATLRSDRTNLAKASIRSPIDGVVLLRKIEPGQTVAASLQAPVLFTLAENLSQMQLQVAVDEADVGQVRDAQPAVFSVDAYPSRSYPAKVTRVGYGAQVANGVVSYLTILKVNNDDLSLRPGMTATAEITVLSRQNALLVPNAALRYVPPAMNAPRAKPTTSIVGSLIPRPPAGPVIKPANREAARSSAQTVWVLRGGEPVAVAVTVGATDGRHTEILKGELKEGQPVITDNTGPGAK
jgi:HlyD family secretion protein